MPQAALASRGVSAMVRAGESTITSCVCSSAEEESSWSRVKPAQPVPRMARTGLREVVDGGVTMDLEGVDDVWERVVGAMVGAGEGRWSRISGMV